MKTIKDDLFASIAAPVTLFVFSTFWGLYAINREFIYPKKLDGILPFWTTQFFHTTIVTILLECVVDRVVYPSRRKGISLLLLFGAGYLGWISYCSSQSGKWPYPFLRLMSPTAFSIFVAASALMCVFFYIVVEKYND